MSWNYLHSIYVQRKNIVCNLLHRFSTEFRPPIAVQVEFFAHWPTFLKNNIFNLFLTTFLTYLITINEFLTTFSTDIRHTSAQMAYLTNIGTNTRHISLGKSVRNKNILVHVFCTAIFFKESSKMGISLYLITFCTKNVCRTC